MHPRRLKKIGTVLGVVLFAMVALAETAFWIGHRVSQPETGSGTCAVLILGYPTQANGQPHPVQQRRVAAGVAAYRTHQCSRMVMSGGAAQNDHVEAVSMAAIAQDLGVPANKIVIEDQAQNTWENVGCSMNYLQGYDQIFLISDSLHVHRGKRYFCRQAPCDSVQTVSYYQPLDRLWWKAPAALLELHDWIRDIAIYERNEANNAPPYPS